MVDILLVHSVGNVKNAPLAVSEKMRSLPKLMSLSYSLNGCWASYLKKKSTAKQGELLGIRPRGARTLTLSLSLLLLHR